MSRYIWFLAMAAGIIACSGCEEYEYNIEMVPQGASIRRTIDLPGNLPGEEVQAIARAYPERIDADTFTGVFEVELPNDVGGAGFYTVHQTSMGSTATYAERVGGNDDMYGQLEKAEQLIDKFADFAVGWLEFELGREPDFGRLREFVDVRVRRDAKNIGLYFLLGAFAGKYDPNENEMQARAIHYLEERGYLKPGQAGVLMARAERTGEEELWMLLHDMAAREMGYSPDSEEVKKLEFLKGGENAEVSAKCYIRSTERYRQMWEQERIDIEDPNAEPPDVEVWEFITGGERLFEFDLFRMPPGVRVRLRCTGKPFETNGEWHGDSNEVWWSDTIADANGLSTFFYASWSTPDRDFQLDHFGRVMLDGKELAEYCYWEKSTESNELCQWSAFLTSVDPNQDIDSRMKAFRFAGESTDPNVCAAASVPCKLILKAMSLR